MTEHKQPTPEEYLRERLTDGEAIEVVTEAEGRLRDERWRDLLRDYLERTLKPAKGGDR